MARTLAVSGSTGSSPVARRSVATSGGSTPRRAPVNRESSTTRRTVASGGSGGRGFGAYNRAVTSTRQEFGRLDVQDEPIAIAFLEDEPFGHVFRHWVNKKPRNCIGDDCPLCEREIPARPILFFNVVDLSSPTTVLLWEASAEPAKRIEKRYDDLAAKGKHLNDPGVYFAVSKFKKDNGYFEYVVDKLPESELVDDWKAQPLSQGDRMALGEKLYDEGVIKLNTREELEEFIENEG